MGKIIRIYSCFSCDKRKFQYGAAYCKVNDMRVEQEYQDRVLHKECQLEDAKDD